MFKRLRKSLILASVLAVAISSIPLQPVSAAGETYTWKDYNTITLSGGDINGTYDLKMSPNSAVQQFSYSEANNWIRHESGCVLLPFYLKLNNDNSATITAQDPPSSGPSFGVQLPDDTYRCTAIKTKEECSGIWPFESCKDVEDGPMFPGVVDGYHNKTVTINGTRPRSETATETEQEKGVHIYINSPRVSSQSPATINITVTGSNGYTNTVTAPQEAALGSDDPNDEHFIEPEFRPTQYNGDFVLEPGEYQVCWTEIIPQCKTFTKVKFESLILEYGEDSSVRQIDVKVEVHTTRPCGSDLRRSAETVTIRKLPDGAPQEKQTEEFTSTPGSNEAGAICTVNVIMTKTVTFTDLDPGQYEVCTPIGGCVTYTKVEGQKGEVTIVISSEFAAPDEEPVCNTGTGFASFLAFVICPFTALITDATDFIEKNLIIPYLTVSPLETGGTVHTIWEAIRNLANVAFIIAFLIIVFSQSTSIGISNYGIKRMLPRLVMVAVGANLSFFIVAFAIDAFNVFGAGVADLVLAALPDAAPNQGDNPDVAQGTVAGLVGFGALAIAAALTSAGAVLGWLWGLIVAAFAIVVMAVIVLVSRQIAIIILVILSPLAFVAWLLPNTEKYFTKWRQLLIQLLLMYPMIILLFAVGKIFTALVNAGEFQLTSGGAPEQVAESIKILLGFFATILPLAALPATFLAGGALMHWMYNFWQPKVGAPAKAAGEAMRKIPSSNLVQSRFGGAKLAQSNNKFVRGIGWVAMQKQRRERAENERERELNKARTEYLADVAANDPGWRKRAAGVGGSAAEQRILAEALAARERAGNEELENARALYGHVLRRAGVDRKTFATGALTDYLKNGTDEVKDRSGKTVFKFSENQGLMEAMLDSAARDGEVVALQEARLSSQLGSEAQQKMVDEVIDRNKGSIIPAGGYHLTTGDPSKGQGFGLAMGRMRDSSGNPITNPADMRARMQTAQLKAMSGQGASTIAGYSWGTHQDIADYTSGASGTAVLNSLSASERNQLRQRLTEALSPTSNTASKIENPEAVRQILSRL